MMTRLTTSLFLAALSLLLGACETTKQPSTDSTITVPATAKHDTTASAVTKSDAIAAASAPAHSVTPPVAKAVDTAPLVKPENLLAEGRDLYEKGDYKNAIRKLTMARDASEDSPAVKQNSLKFLAFSYCVSNQRPQCKAQFTSLLKLAPSFQLSRGEAGHPLWGPVFKEVKDTREVKAKDDGTAKK
jgi:hypothetical protein